jgi:hypothetical protein
MLRTIPMQLPRVGFTLQGWGKSFRLANRNIAQFAGEWGKFRGAGGHMKMLI